MQAYSLLVQQLVDWKVVSKLGRPLGQLRESSVTSNFHSLLASSMLGVVATACSCSNSNSNSNMLWIVRL